MKTKNQELKVIEEAINKLGYDSYLGPWLRGIKFELEAMVRADCFPRVNLTESQRHADKILARARGDAEKIVANASRKAGEILDAADTDSQRARARIITAAENVAAIAGRI